MAIRLFKRLLSDFMKVAFFDSWNAENKFVLHIDTFKRLFIDQKSRLLRCPEFKFWILRPFAFLKYHLIDFVLIALFDYQDTEN
jgi:hypothetical protein